MDDLIVRRNPNWTVLNRHGLQHDHGRPARTSISVMENPAFSGLLAPYPLGVCHIRLAFGYASIELGYAASHAIMIRVPKISDSRMGTSVRSWVI